MSSFYVILRWATSLSFTLSLENLFAMNFGKGVVTEKVGALILKNYVKWYFLLRIFVDDLRMGYLNWQLLLLILILKNFTEKQNHVEPLFLGQNTIPHQSNIKDSLSSKRIQRYYIGCLQQNLGRFKASI